MATEAGRGLRTGGLGWLAWVALAGVWFATVQVRPMLDPDEGRYAEIPREMLVSGDWITPRLDDLKYFEKPPLQYWATAAVYSVFGLSEWTSRLWTVGLAFACLPMVFGWTARLYGRNAGLAALVALAVSPLFVLVGHLNLLDAGFTFWLTGAVFAFAAAQSSEIRSQAERRWMLLAWVAAALAVLSKGIVVGVLAGGALILYTALERDARPWKRLHCLLGVPLFLLITAPWFVLVTLRNPDFPGFFFVHEHFARFLTTVHQRVEPWWFFLPLLLIGALPWLGPLWGGSRQAWRAPGPTPHFKPLKFLLIFSAVTLVFFSASGSKLVPYILPMMPPLAAVVGVFAAERRGFLPVAARVGAGLAVFCVIVGVVYSARRNSFVPSEAVVWMSLGLVAAGFSVLVTWKPKGVQAAGIALASACAGVLVWQCLMCAYTVIPPSRSGRDLALAVKPSIQPQTALFSVGQFRETIPPYLRRTLTIVQFQGELEFGLHAEPGRQWASPEQFLERWQASRDAIAFFEPPVWDQYRSRGLPGRVIAADNYTVAVSRQ
jgi:4-amino-4-deoxy-L-arabinose transferase-like glycosyltransferase